MRVNRNKLKCGPGIKGKRNIIFSFPLFMFLLSCEQPLGIGSQLDVMECIENNTETKTQIPEELSVNLCFEKYEKVLPHSVLKSEIEIPFSGKSSPCYTIDTGTPGNPANGNYHCRLIIQLENVSSDYIITQISYSLPPWDEEGEKKTEYLRQGYSGFSWNMPGETEYITLLDEYVDLSDYDSFVDFVNTKNKKNNKAEAYYELLLYQSIILEIKGLRLKLRDE